MLVRLLTASAIALAASASAEVAPFTPEIENGFDYVGQDISHAYGKAAEDCTPLCENTPDCIAFSWNSYQGGTCWLKRGAYPIIVNPTVKSARLTHEDPHVHNSCFPYADVDFVGNDIGNAKANDISGCCAICKKTLGCRAYSWNDYQGGTCWLKSKRDKVIVKPGVKSADAYPSELWYTQPFFDPVFPLQTGIDFVDHDIGNVRARDAFECVKLCNDQAKNIIDNNPRCRAFSWSDYNGGTCWLKSGKNETIAKPGVISGYWKTPYS